MNAEALTLVRRELREQLLQRVDARGLATAPRTERRLRVREEALALLRERGAILPQRELARMVNEVSDEVVGFGPIEFLLEGPGGHRGHGERTRRRVRGARGADRKGAGRLFEGEEAVLHLIERIVGPLGLRVDESSPWADARLPEGRRVHAIIPPLSLRGPVADDPEVLAGAHHRGGPGRARCVGPRMLRFLTACVRGRANVDRVAAAQGPARPRCSACCRRSSPTTSGSSRSRMPRNSGWPNRTWSR